MKKNGSVHNACEISRANKNRTSTESNSSRHPKTKKRVLKKNLAIDDQPTVLAGIVLRDFSQCEDLSVATHLPIFQANKAECEEKGGCSNKGGRAGQK